MFLVVFLLAAHAETRKIECGLLWDSIDVSVQSMSTTYFRIVFQSPSCKRTFSLRYENPAVLDCPEVLGALKYALSGSSLCSPARLELFVVEQNKMLERFSPSGWTVAPPNLSPEESVHCKNAGYDPEPGDPGLIFLVSYMTGVVQIAVTVPGITGLEEIQTVKMVTRPEHRICPERISRSSAVRLSAELLRIWKQFVSHLTAVGQPVVDGVPVVALREGNDGNRCGCEMKIGTDGPVTVRVTADVDNAADILTVSGKHCSTSYTIPPLHFGNSEELCNIAKDLASNALNSQGGICWPGDRTDVTLTNIIDLVTSLMGDGGDDYGEIVWKPTTVKSCTLTSPKDIDLPLFVLLYHEDEVQLVIDEIKSQIRQVFSVSVTVTPEMHKCPGYVSATKLGELQKALIDNNQNFWSKMPPARPNFPPAPSKPSRRATSVGEISPDILQPINAPAYSHTHVDPQNGAAAVSQSLFDSLRNGIARQAGRPIPAASNSKAKGGGDKTDNDDDGGCLDSWIAHSIFSILTTIIFYHYL